MHLPVFSICRDKDSVCFQHHKVLLMRFILYFVFLWREEGIDDSIKCESQPVSCQRDARRLNAPHKIRFLSSNHFLPPSFPSLTLRLRYPFKALASSRRKTRGGRIFVSFVFFPSDAATYQRSNERPPYFRYCRSYFDWW